MGKIIRRVLAIICIAVLVVSVYKIISIQKEYKVGTDEYNAISDSVVQERADVVSNADDPDPASDPAGTDNTPVCPIEVDFDALLEKNPDVVGWIYCEDTKINYPVLQGDDDEYYLHHTVDGTYNSSASIFVEALNRRDFQDANTIIYGHHMKNGSMFAGIEKYKEQEYYEEHPVMWLLTPTQNYEVVLYAGYHTKADSDTYTIFEEPDDELTAYEQSAVEQSDFTTDVFPAEDSRCVVLSTCAYIYTDARYVLHGYLVPAN